MKIDKGKFELLRRHLYLEQVLTRNIKKLNKKKIVEKNYESYGKVSVDEPLTREACVACTKLHAVR